MNRGDTVGAMRADDSQVGHANCLRSAPSSIEAHALNPSLVAGKTGSDLIKQAAIDLEDDLQMTRQHHLEPLRPAISPELRGVTCDWCTPESFV